jgi:hypothetical protein
VELRKDKRTTKRQDVLTYLYEEKMKTNASLMWGGERLKLNTDKSIEPKHKRKQ